MKLNKVEFTWCIFVVRFAVVWSGWKGQSVVGWVVNESEEAGVILNAIK